MTDERKRNLLILPLAAVVMLGWSASLIVGLLTNSFVALTATTPLMLALAGYVFGVSLVRKGGNGNEDK